VAATQDRGRSDAGGFPRRSSACLSRPAPACPCARFAELIAYLDRAPATDFIESVNDRRCGWTIGGLNEERFTLRFPFSWRNQRWLFDRYVKLQRAVGFKRTFPTASCPILAANGGV
jgi:hypothetical protein